MNNARKPLTALFALGAALAMPLAFAQSDTTTDTSTQGAATTTYDTMAKPAPTAETAKKVTWADLDGNKDGKLSKTEAAPLDSLSKVFDQADTNADGTLTADEYKAYIAKNGTGSTGKQG